MCYANVRHSTIKMLLGILIGSFGWTNSKVHVKEFSLEAELHHRTQYKPKRV